MTDAAELVKLAGNLPLQYVDGPDYCTVKDATGMDFALTVQPELMRAMEAALAAQQDGAWQPIATAPKDGRRVLLVNSADTEPDDEVIVGWWDMNEWRDYGDIGCNGQYNYAPTHWQPLPKPPMRPEQTEET